MSVYNGERFLREAADSILSQTFKDFEFIIIDDGSTDGGAAILAEYERSDPRLRVYHQDNQGLIPALNRGCGLARGKYIARMDADDISVPDRLERQNDFMEHHPTVGLLGGAMEEIDQQGRHLSLDRPPLENRSIRAGLHAMTYPICHPTVLMRKQAFDTAGGYRPQYLHAEDYDLWLRITEQWQAANLPDVAIRKRIHSGQVSNRHIRQQIITILGAIAAADMRSRGETDPTDQVERVTQALIEQMGVSKATLRQAQSGAYSYWIDSMARTSQDDAALRLIAEVAELGKQGQADHATLADAWLQAARIYYRQGKTVRASACAGRAVMTRPVILGRPIKRAFQHLVKKSHPATSPG